MYAFFSPPQQSLYPACNYYEAYPVCHPTVLSDPELIDPSLEPYEGLVQLTILPPQDLFLPVLPIRCNGKLVFALCRTCSEQEQQEPCRCSDANRCLTGVWAVCEVRLAISKGYKVMKIWQVYHYEEMSRYDPLTGKGGLFSEYVSMFLRIKQENSDFPSWVHSEEDKDQYVRDYHRSQGILLDKDKIKRNPGLRLVAKLLLNCCWGKFSQRTSLPSTLFVKTRLELARICNDPTREVIDVHVISDKFLAVDIKRRETYEDMPSFQSEILAVLTTTYGRIRLYQALDRVKDGICYLDTDSVIFAEPRGANTLHTGELLGELTDEIPPGREITRFLSSGPKTYCFVQDDDKQVIRLKGIRFNYLNSLMFNFDSMKQVVLEEIAQLKTPVSQEIVRTRRDGIIFKRPFTKVYRKVFNKRVLIPGSHTSVPYGFLRDV